MSQASFIGYSFVFHPKAKQDKKLLVQAPTWFLGRKVAMLHFALPTYDDIGGNSVSDEQFALWVQIKAMDAIRVRQTGSAAGQVNTLGHEVEWLAHGPTEKELEKLRRNSEYGKKKLSRAVAEKPAESLRDWKYDVKSAYPASLTRKHSSKTRKRRRA